MHQLRVEWLEEIGLASQLLIGATLVGIVVLHFWARSSARGKRPIQARVISVRREENEDKRSYNYSVHTVYEVPRHGPLTHDHGCDTEGQAILFSRLHKEGSVHKVVVNPSDSDKVFLWDELGKTDWHQFYYLFIALVFLGSAIYAVMEYFDD